MTDAPKTADRERGPSPSLSVASPQFTADGWVAAGDTVYLNAQFNGVVADCDVGSAPRAQREARARLIAGAPEGLSFAIKARVYLLAVLDSELANYCPMDDQYRPIRAKLDPVATARVERLEALVEAADAFIAKATGNATPGDGLASAHAPPPAPSATSQPKASTHDR